MIHCFKKNDINIVLDVESGSIHCVDETVYEILSEFDRMFDEPELMRRFSGRYSIGELSEAYGEIRELFLKGELYSDAEEILPEKHVSDSGQLKALCLNVTHDCNLSCAYCFASQGSYRMEKELMTPVVACEAIDLLLKNSGERRNVEVDFFGGEPLMNFETVKQAVEYGKAAAEKAGKKINFTITTNAVFVSDEVADYINRNMENLVISIDGRQEVHDSKRVFRNGAGSYAKVLKNAVKLVKGRDPSRTYYIRGTFTADNMDFSEDVMHIFNEGFGEISFEPVAGRGGEYHITAEHIEKILEEYDRLADKILEIRQGGEHLNFYHFNAGIYDGPCLYKRIAACGAGHEYLAVSPDGGLYPCHQFVGKEEYRIGNVREGIIKKDVSEMFRDSTVLSKEDCLLCWAKYHCSGGCHANAYYTNGNILKPDVLACAMQKKRLECAIYLETAALLREESDVFVG